MNRKLLQLILLLACFCWIKGAAVLAYNSTASITNLNGDIVTVQLTGIGTLSYTLLNGDFGPIDQLLLEDTTSNTVVQVFVKKSKTGTGIANINAIIGNGSLKKLDASKVDLVGSGLNILGCINQLTINNMTNSAIAIAGLRILDGQKALGKLKCSKVIGSQIRVNGDVGSVTASQMIESDLWVGYIPTSDADPLAGGMFTNSTKITSVNVRGDKNSSVPAFLNSTVAAQTMGKVTLASINTNNFGVAFGVIAATFTNDIIVKSPHFKRPKDGPMLQTLGDFAVRQLFSPIVYTDAADVTDTSATLHGTINPNGLVTFAFFQWGTNLDYDVTTPAELVGISTNLIDYSVALPELTTGQTYYYRIVASNSNGTTTGTNQKFTPHSIAVTPDNMVLIPEGYFQMGDALNEGSLTEQPVHNVYISAYLMDQNEVSFAHWREVMNWATANGYTFDKPGYSIGEDYPVTWISWFDCIKWCNARSEMNGLTPCYYTNAAQTNVYRTSQKSVTNSCVNWNANGYRLPTEAEWEKAARGSFSGLRFPWGTTITHQQADYFSTNSFPYDTSLSRFYNPLFYTGVPPFLAPVTSLTPNGYGLYGMTGNIWEWCWDCVEYLWYQNPAASQPDPIGPNTGKERLIRGGGWASTAYNCRVAYRNYYLEPTEAVTTIGFRCVRR